MVSFIFIKDDATLMHACTVSDIVISGEYIDREHCPSPHLLLDKKALRENGAHALYFNKDSTVSVRTVYAGRGNRPWTGLRWVND